MEAAFLPTPPAELHPHRHGQSNTQTTLSTWKKRFYLLSDPSIPNLLLSFPWPSTACAGVVNTANLENWRKEELTARRHSHILWIRRGTHAAYRSPSRPAITASILHPQELTRGRNLSIFSIKALNSHGSVEYHSVKPAPRGNVIRCFTGGTWSLGTTLTYSRGKLAGYLNALLDIKHSPPRRAGRDG